MVNFISHSVIVGFTAGAAVLIAASQIKHLCLPIARGSSPLETLHTLLTRHSNMINPLCSGCGLVTLAAGIGLKRYLPRFPYMIGAMLVGPDRLGAVRLHYGIATVGALPDHLPPLSMPTFVPPCATSHRPHWPSHCFALTETVSIALDRGKGRTTYRRQPEFIGQGLSNLVGSFFSGCVATGSFNRSGLSHEAGAKTPLAAMLAGVMLMGIVVLVAPLAAYPAECRDGSGVDAGSLGADRSPYPHLRASRSETTVMAVTFRPRCFSISESHSPVSGCR